MPKTATTKAPVAKKAAKKAPKQEASGFAVIATGGKQYRVSPGQKVKIEKISGDFKEGDTITFSNVLLTDNGTQTVFGEPYISGAKVTGTLTSIARHAKVLVIKYKQKSRYFKKNGHRQPYFEVLIDSIS